MPVLATPTLISRDRVLRGLEQLPPFSPVLQKLIGQLAQEDVTFKAVATLVEKDAVLAGHLLRVVNSAAGGFRSRVNSVTHAISLLGVVKLRNIVLGLAVNQMWTRLRTPPSWSQARFNLHAVAVATFADLFVQEIPAVYPEGAFIAGLLHDLGSLLIASALREEFEREWQRVLPEGNDETGWMEWEQNTLGCTHASLSAAALERWNLPTPVRDAVERHHVPLPALGQPWPEVWLLEQVLAVADAEACQLGFSYLSTGTVSAELTLEPNVPWAALREPFFQQVQPLQAFYLGLTAGKTNYTGAA